MTDWVDNLAHRRVFWLTLATLALFMEAAALYYQYVLNYYPCMVCIHIRLVIAGLRCSGSRRKSSRQQLAPLDRVVGSF